MAAARTTRKRKADGADAAAPTVEAFIGSVGQSASSDLLKPVIPVQTLYNQFGAIGGSLGPARVSAIIREADGGRPASFVDLTHEARQKDGQFQCVMQGRELALACLPWGLRLPDEPTPQEEQASEACELAIRSCPSFQPMLAHLDGEGLLFGYARSETVWKLGDSASDQRLRGLLIPDYFKNISCRRFGFHSQTGKLLFNPGGHGNVDTDGIDLFEDYPLGKFLGVERRVNGDVPAREGLARVLVWAALFRNWTLRDWLSLAELAWKPLRTGKFSKDTVSREDITSLQNILERLTTLGWAAVPNAVELDIHFPRGTADTGQGNHQLLCEYLGALMAKAVLGGTLTVEAGNRGARSLGEVMERVKGELRDADAVSNTAPVQRYLVEPFFRLNYGESVRPSTFFFHTEDAVDSLQFAQSMKALVDAGDTKLSVAWVHDKIGAPVAADDEPVLGMGGSSNDDGKDAGDGKASDAGND